MKDVIAGKPMVHYTQSKPILLNLDLKAIDTQSQWDDFDEYHSLYKNGKIRSSKQKEKRLENYM